MTRVLIVLPSASYRVADFVAAAKTLRVEAVIATDAAQVMGAQMAERLVRIDPGVRSGRLVVWSSSPSDFPLMRWWRPTTTVSSWQLRRP